MQTTWLVGPVRLLMNIEKEDIGSVKKDIDQCLKLVEEGADWEKKNKLKIFEGVYCILIRDFKKASNLFVSSIAFSIAGVRLSANNITFPRGFLAALPIV